MSLDLSSTSSSFVPLGVVGAAELVVVDGAGALTPGHGEWTLEWWIRSEDRWHVPSNEASTRQEFSEGGSAIATRLRVPSGTVTATTWMGVAAPGPMAVTDIHNDSAVPVAVALVLRQSGKQPISVRTNTITVGGCDVVHFDRDVAQIIGPSNYETVAEAVVEEAAVTAQADATSVAVVFPIAHRTTFSFVIGASDQPVQAESVTDLAAIERGWATHLERTTLFSTGDPETDTRLMRARRRLMFATAQTPGEAPLSTDLALIVRALLESGLTAEGEELTAKLHREPVLSSPLDAAAFLVAAAGCVRMGQVSPPDETIIANAVAVIDRSTRRPRRRAADEQGLVLSLTGDGAALSSLWAIAGLRSAAVLLVAHEQSDAADHVSQLASRLHELLEQYDPEVLVGATAAMLDLADYATIVDVPTSCVTALDAAATVLLTHRRFVRTGTWGTVIAQAAEAQIPGKNWEIYELPTMAGSASVAVRWHGENPALLWEVNGIDPTLICEGFGDKWASSEPSGETLLGPARLLN